MDSNEKTNERFSKNLIEHQNKNIFENIGKTRGFDKLNKLYGMLWAIESNKIKQPFALIPADVILEKPINLDLHEYPEIYFNPDKDFLSYSQIINKEQFNNNSFIYNKIKLDDINQLFSDMRKSKIIGKSIIVY